jgi:cobyrinic acid a,c-diamide synthase
MNNGFIVAGTNSGCGKTTVTIGLLKLLQNKGFRVAPFKIGPDFIDPMFHEFVSGKPSYNLDNVMQSEEVVRYLFDKHCDNSDIAVVEGVMGLYDGLGIEGRGSAAEISRVLNLPVILVVNCEAISQSVAAIVLGYKQFNPEVNIAGVILNRMSGEKHFRFLKEIIETKTNTPCLGYVSNNQEYNIKSRHLGLVQAEEIDNLSEKIELLAKAFSETIDIAELLKVSELKLNEKRRETSLPKFQYKQDLSELHLGVALDRAFRFYYRDNLKLLEECGARICYFSPLNDKQIPENINALYIGGGYPEVFAKQLSDNILLLKDIKTKAEDGMPVFAECGGLMFLTSAIALQDIEYQMVGIFNCKTRMTSHLQRFGYANVTFNGVTTCSHEFHHSVIENDSESNYSLCYDLMKPDTGDSWKCGFMYKNVLGGYAHIHFYSDPQFFEQLCNLWRKRL